MARRLLAAGTTLSGRYQVAELIGESDLSAVYAAADLRGGPEVALKVFDQAVMARAAALSEYQSLARQASGLGAEGIARAYDFGIDGNLGVPFSTAERVSWPSLDKRVLAQGPLGAADLSRALAVLARALDTAHAARIVHRDLKPQNVFISPDNPEWVRITDFGVSAVRRGAAEAMGWGGPPGYTPPDAVDAAAAPTPGVDLFALGVVAFFALTRGTPFRSLRSSGFDPNAHWTELNQSLSPISERAKEIGVALDPIFDPWFARALALSPHDRFRSAGEMARELEVLAGTVSLRGGGGPRAMPGIAAAIAQPLVFQPEPSPASLGLSKARASGAVASAARASGSDLAPLRDAASASVATDEPGPARSPQKKPIVPIAIGAAVVLLAGLAWGGLRLLSTSEPAAAPAEASATATPTALPSLLPAAKASAETAGPPKVRFACQPGPCEWVVCDGKNVTGIDGEIEISPGPHECSASKSGHGSKSLSFSAAPGGVSTVTFELPPLPVTPAAPAASLASVAKTKSSAVAAAPTATAKPVTPAKPITTAKPAASAPTKPVASAAKDAKAAASSKTKKKCSTFLGCK